MPKMPKSESRIIKAFIMTLMPILSLTFTFTFIGCSKKEKKESPKEKISVSEVKSTEMAKIPAGSFVMGSSEGTELETPERKGATEEFWIDKYEYPNYAGALPLTKVTWYEAQAKCVGAGKRLCTEMEWEKACRGLNAHVYSYGDSYDFRKCRTSLSWNEGAAKTGSHSECKSEYGVYDMNGNVYEWTSGFDIESREVRGGFWSSDASNSRCSNRIFFHPTYAEVNIGFRCCKSAS